MVTADSWRFSADELKRYMDGRQIKWLIERTGISKIRMHAIFSGNEPRASELIRICQILKIQPVDLCVIVKFEPQINPLTGAPGRGRPRKVKQEAVAA